MSETFISRPFIILDGEDDNGVRAEVRVQKGQGMISQVEEKKNRDQVRFSVSSDNLKKHGLSGWVNKKTDPELYDLLIDAYNNDAVVYVRFEKKRKNHVDRSLPIKDIAPQGNMEETNENTINIVSHAKTNEDDEWIANSESLTLPMQDQIQGGVKVKEEDLKKISRNRSTYSTSPWEPDTESPRYKTKNPDGSINPGSDAVSAVSSTYITVYKYLTDKSRDLIKDPLSQESKKTIINVAYAVVNAANRAQLVIYRGAIDKPMMAKSSHIRARSIIFHIMETSHPITLEEIDSPDALKKWSHEVSTQAAKIWDWSIKVVDEMIS